MTSQAYAVPPVASRSSWRPLAIAACSVAIILAMVCGVGIPDNLILRHIVQTLPLWFAVVLGARRSNSTSWISLPLFLFWLGIMALIWLYLLGLSRVVNGHFSPLEITMTIIVGLSSIVGISMSYGLRSLSAIRALCLFVAFAALQFVCFRVSFLPSIAHR